MSVKLGQEVTHGDFQPETIDISVIQGSPACNTGDPYHLKSVSPSETRSETVRIFIPPCHDFVFCRMGTVIGQLYFPADRF